MTLTWAVRREADGKIAFVAIVETTSEGQPTRITLSVLKGS